MVLQRCTDLSAAVWLSESDADPWRLVTFGPSTFLAYARLRYLPDPVRAGMDEADAQTPPGHATDINAARTAVKALRKHSGSVDACYVCVWEGLATFRDPGLSRGPLVVLPHRRYILFSGALDDLDDWNDLFDSEYNWAPAFVWPTDHRWCFASDIDPHWAGIGADTQVIDKLVADTSMDIVWADPSTRQPTYY